MPEYDIKRQLKAIFSADVKVIDLNPNFSVERFVNQWPYKNQEDRKLGFDALRKAGLPD